MSSWYVTHEDTLSYHAQIIQWIEKHKAIPGIVHLHVRYGLQSSWFVSCALFSFDFLGAPDLTFINIAVIFWYIYLVVDQIRKLYSEKTKVAQSLLLLILLIFNLWSYNQIRLTATSANPDFIATLYIWLLLYLVLINTTNLPAKFMLILILGIFAFSIKLSAIPVIILVVYGFIKLISFKKIKLIFISIAISLLIIIPFIARNIITSGYPLFPSVFPDVANVDWKLGKARGHLIIHYITAYARIRSQASITDINNSIGMSYSEWLPIWWQNQSLADKAIIIIMIITLIVVFIKPKRVINSNLSIKVALITCLAGIIFWFIQAPDPRFGFGFIVGFPIIVTTLYLDADIKKYEASLKKLFMLTILIVIFTILAYSTYRITNFFSPLQLLTSKGFKLVKHKTINCGNININIPQKIYSCGATNIPCAYDSCKTFQPRGKKITDGFKAK